MVEGAFKKLILNLPLGYTKANAVYKFRIWLAKMQNTEGIQLQNWSSIQIITLLPEFKRSVAQMVHYSSHDINIKHICPGLRL